MRLDPVFGQFRVNEGEDAKGKNAIMDYFVVDGLEHFAFKSGALPINAVYVEHTWAVPPHVHHGFYELSFVVSGEGTYRIDGRPIRARKGDVFFLSDNVVHVHEEPPLPFCQVFVSFVPSMLGLAARSGAESIFYEPFFDLAHDYKLSVAPSDYGWVCSQFLSIVHVAQMRSTHRDEMLRTHLHALFRVLLSQYDGGATSEQATRARYLREVDRYVRAHLQGRIRIENLAAALKKRPAAFSREFTEVTGMRPTDYVNRVRVDEAKRLLAESDRSITEILYDSGFQNSTHFNKMFKRLVGRSPGEHRAMARAKVRD
jgi:AraC-like DNA-binding protein/mannose-6-phosphate isomerase-like protein (cupin superfamily)